MLAVAGLAVTGCSSSPPRLLADTPSGNPLASRLCGTGPMVPGLGAPQLQAAYRAPALFARGITGAGTTIAVIVPYASPWIASDVATYSRRYRLPGIPRQTKAGNTFGRRCRIYCSRCNVSNGPKRKDRGA
jgi:hypothetical protein